MREKTFLDAHLNVNWLRPESALWDAIASSVISEFPVRSPSLDLGCGNGIFSFITAGGAFSLDYDWYRNANPEGFWDNRDIYDNFTVPVRQNVIVKEPEYRMDYALDAKSNLLAQARALKFYRQAVHADANYPLPFHDGSFETVFSNILYWLNSAEQSLKEIKRILRPGGKGMICLQDPTFKEYCPSYRWKELNSEVLRLLNRGRSESSFWTMSYGEIAGVMATLGLKVVAHSRYLSTLTLRAWDIGLRPLSPVLIKMVQKLTEADRLSIKSEWIGIVRPFVAELYELDRKSTEHGGYHFICFEKT